MTLRKALQILIEHAAANQVGTGCGIRSLPSETQRKEVAEAVERVWRRAYGFPMGEAERMNLGLRRP